MYFPYVSVFCQLRGSGDSGSVPASGVGIQRGRELRLERVTSGNQPDVAPARADRDRVYVAQLTQGPLRGEMLCFALPADTVTFDADAWALAASHGILGLLVDPAHGGQGRSIVEALLAFEGLGLGTDSHGTVFAIASQVFAMQRALESAGSAQQLERWMPSLVNGSAIGSGPKPRS